jgi:hypothetical protein
MKKIKWTIMTLVILLSVAGAYATRPKYWSPQEFYWNGAAYIETKGTYGRGFYCQETNAVNCTYILDGSTYVMYRLGVYTEIPYGVTKDETKKAK